jgi:hypothetical protein
MLHCLHDCAQPDYVQAWCGGKTIRQEAGLADVQKLATTNTSVPKGDELHSYVLCY